MNEQKPSRKELRIATEDQQRVFSPVYELVEEAIADEVFPGCAFGVLSHGDVVALGGAGRQTYDMDSPAILPATVYDLASLTKVVATTAMAMAMVESGQLDLDMSIAARLPEFLALSGDLSERAAVTVRHLLAHNSGLPVYARLFERYTTAESLFEACAHMPLEAPPGTRAAYSDIGFILLGRVLERVAGESLEVYCGREIFEPLGMGGTGFRPAAAERSQIPPTEDDRLFRYRVIQGEVQDENCWVLGGMSGHAGLFGNVPDLLRFSDAVLSPSLLFKEVTIRLFAARTGLPPSSSRALGWDTPSTPSSSGTMFSEHSVGHLGYAGTSLWIDLRDQCAVVLLTNRTWPSRENQKIREFRPVFHNAVRAALLLRERST